MATWTTRVADYASSADRQIIIDLYNLNRSGGRLCEPPERLPIGSHANFNDFLPAHTTTVFVEQDGIVVAFGSAVTTCQPITRMNACLHGYNVLVVPQGQLGAVALRVLRALCLEVGKRGATTLVIPGRTTDEWIGRYRLAPGGVVVEKIAGRDPVTGDTALVDLEVDIEAAGRVVLPGD